MLLLIRVLLCSDCSLVADTRKHVFSFEEVNRVLNEKKICRLSFDCEVFGFLCCQYRMKKRLLIVFSLCIILFVNP